MKLDDIGTAGIRRTRSVPQGDPCAADLFGADLDTPAAKFCDMCEHKNGDCLWETGILVSCSSRTISGSLRCRQKGKRRCGARRHKTAWLLASLCRTQRSLDAHERKGSKLWECGSLSTVTSQKNWLSVRYQCGDVSTRCDMCCVTTMWL